MLQEDDGVVVANGGFHQALGVVGCGRMHNFQTWYLGVPHFQALGVLSGSALAGPASLGHANHHRHFALPAGHQAQLGCLVADLVHSQAGEVNKHDLSHRPHANQCRAGSGTGDGVLRDGRVANSLRSELIEQRAGHPKGSAVYPYVLAQKEHAFIPQHFLTQCLANRLLI